ncbi:jg18544 [Pararge aegeria aegeria]|uniref:Jg18544 protein n=1 Tax=Pararge aegeria aegeria TaxID=348720 RepID=A0A8S4QMC9_9NEOP|nr:jg18544 [Pararge aegeria aegeria]
MREIVLRRADFLSNKSKKSSVHIALVILEICKLNNGSMNVKDFSQSLKKCGAVNLNEDLIEGFALGFPGPGSKKVKTVDLANLVEYVHRKWPVKKLPPTPPPEVFIPETKGERKQKKKKK